MLTKLFAWAKSHKLSTLLLLVLAYLFLKNLFGVNLLSSGYSGASYSGYAPMADSSISLSKMGGVSNLVMPSQVREVAPVATGARMVITDTYLSVLVKSVRDTVDKILADTTSMSGYMVSNSLSNPDQAATASLVLRVPVASRVALLAKIRSYGLKVTSENLTGTDVTDQYVDNEARLAPLLKSRQKLEQLLDEAQKVPEILEVQRELSALQLQIDNLKGQQEYLKKSSELSKVTIYLSTDEFSLPYAPEASWRPEVILKEAVRSMITTLRQFGTWAIWLAVYSPLVLIGFVVYKKFLKKRLV